jgi:ribonuclease HII
LEFVPPGIKIYAGVDEAGRGCLAGPVVAAAVILPPLAALYGLNDSKKLSPQKRAVLREAILAIPGVFFAVGLATEREIDELNILQATRMAMVRAITALPLKPDFALVDGRPWREFPCPHCGVIGGDALCPSIAAASVLAKCARDDMMVELHSEDPRYEFHINKGYGTAAHLAALARYGPGRHHRRTFAPVAQATLPGLG